MRWRAILYFYFKQKKYSIEQLIKFVQVDRKVFQTPHNANAETVTCNTWKMTEYKVIIPDEHYSILKFNQDKLPGVAVVNSALRQFEPKVVFGLV